MKTQAQGISGPHIEMETDSAACITMLMDRLQTVEAAQQAFQDTNEQLRLELQDVLVANGTPGAASGSFGEQSRP